MPNLSHTFTILLVSDGGLFSLGMQFFWGSVQSLTLYWSVSRVFSIWIEPIITVMREIEQARTDSVQRKSRINTKPTMAFPSVAKIVGQQSTHMKNFCSLAFNLSYCHLACIQLENCSIIDEMTINIWRIVKFNFLNSCYYVVNYCYCKLFFSHIYNSIFF